MEIKNKCINSVFYSSSNKTYCNPVFQMDKSCPDQTCDFSYKTRKKPFKCPKCSAYIGKMSVTLHLILFCFPTRL